MPSQYAVSTGRLCRMESPVALGTLQTVVGTLLFGATDDAVCMLEFAEPEELAGRIERLCARHEGCAVNDDHPLIRASRLQLEEYFAGRRREFDLPLCFAGTKFQESVWSTLRRIPYGATWSYLELAKQVGDVQATRAVGAANGANPIAILIPCHRVINANGQLGGFGGGVWRKRILLDLERGQTSLAF
jgi:AraC family transcriptional regulator of adaptative response/methylated-DNA-[protein]-cysteine methyltransferase